MTNQQPPSRRESGATPAGHQQAAAVDSQFVSVHITVLRSIWADLARAIGTIESVDRSVDPNQFKVPPELLEDLRESLSTIEHYISP